MALYCTGGRTFHRMGSGYNQCAFCRPTIAILPVITDAVVPPASLLPMSAAGSAPVAKNDFYTFPASIGATAPAPGILINDQIPATCVAPDLKVTVGPTQGTITVDQDGTFEYTPTNFPATAREEVQYTITSDEQTSTGYIVLIPTSGMTVPRQGMPCIVRGPYSPAWLLACWVACTRTTRNQP
jgi:hypothetical protein